MPCVSFQTAAVLSPLVLTLMSPHFSFSFLLLKLSGVPLWFGLTVLQQFIFCSVKSLYNSGEEKELSICNL